MKKIIYIAPHLSSGGLPQYLYKKIENLINTYEIYVIEYQDVTGGVLVIQKNKIKKLLGDRLITLGWEYEDKVDLINIIKKINPDIIHFEEIPEYFMDDRLAKQIYTDDRKYKIFETSHDSSVDTNTKRFLPDKFILVSMYQIKMLSSLNIDSVVVEYPIEYQQRPNREEALKKLGLDPTYKHVLHVGLYTPRKNQKEFFEYASKFIDEKVIFHSVGNQADNFRDYWEPLMQNKPSNVVWHGEKSNIDDYYAAMDLFLFTSKGTINDKETMPLVIREAISWDIPTLIYNLPVYENYFDKYEIIDYLDFNNFDKNVSLIRNKLFNYVEFEETPIIRENKIDIKTENDDFIVIISTYPSNNLITNTTKKCIDYIKSQGYKTMLTSHYPIPSELQELCDYSVFDKNNLLTKHDFYHKSMFENPDFKVHLNLESTNNDLYHGPAVYTNYYNALSFVKQMGFKNALCINYDVYIQDDTFIPKIKENLNKYNAVYNKTLAQEGWALRTVIYATNVDFFLQHFPLIIDESSYTNWEKNVGSESNGLENIYYHTLKNNLDNVLILNDDEYNKLLENCERDFSTMCEYFAILPIQGEKNKFIIWYNNNSPIDDKNMSIKYYKNDILVDDYNFNVKGVFFAFDRFEFKQGEKYRFELFEEELFKKSCSLDDNSFINLNKNGFINIKK